jgi:protein tyrosine/serine phosphatase
VSNESTAIQLLAEDATISMLVNLNSAQKGKVPKLNRGQEVLSIVEEHKAASIVPLFNALGDAHEACIVKALSSSETIHKMASWLSEDGIKRRFQTLRSLQISAPRWKSVEGVANFRDASMQHFPQGLLYRSADLSGLTETGLKQLSRYVHTIIDVRSMPEVKRNGTIGPLDSPFSATQLASHGIERHHVPIFKETDYSPEAIAHRHGLYKNGAEGFVEAYRGILEHCGAALQAVLSALISKSIKQQNRRGVLVHCSAGKDRTGILCALVLLYAGVSAENVASEYELTTVGLAGKKRAILESLSRPGADLGSREQVESMMGSPKIVMLTSIAVMEAEFGGYEAIVMRSGVPASDLDIFRAYTAEQPSVKL